jgi:hypothetical protein
MFNRLKTLRTNENVLIAVDAILHSKSAFLTVFLMTYMIRISAVDSPVNYIIFKLVGYVLMAVLAAILMRFISKHLTLSWRLGILLSAVQIVAIILFHDYVEIFPYILAVIGGFEATLYWRPFMYLSITEVSNARRLRFNSFKQIIGEIIRIIMPIVIGVAVVDSSYLSTANIILVLSLVQFFLSILFRPTRPIEVATDKLSLVFRKITKNRPLCRSLLISFLRGALVSSSAFVIVPILLIYAYSNSDLDLGIYTALAYAVSIVILLIVRKAMPLYGSRKIFLFVAAALTLAIPIIILLSPSLTMAIVFYILTISVLDGAIHMLAIIETHNLIKNNPIKKVGVLEIETINEVFLCIGRVLSLVALLVVIVSSGMTYLPIFAVMNALVIVPLAAMIGKDEK